MTGQADPGHASGWTRIRTLLAGALERPPEDRPRFLRRACHGDTGLYRRVEALLRHEGRDDLLAESRLPEALTEDSTTPMPSQIGPYRLLRKLGDGGMGTVFLAEAPDRNGEPRRVAVKILKPGLETGELIARFHAERRILAQLRHPYLVELLGAGTTDAGEDGGRGSRPYLVMEAVDGEPIDGYCRRRALSIDRRLELFRKVCAAVHFAHRNLVLHCDLKPANILVTADGAPKLLDFGIAKLLRHDPEGSLTLTRLGLRPVTPRYASPEQVAGEPVTTASDVYSLGVVLYELLTGRRPYRFDTWEPHHVARVIRERTPPRPSTVVRTGGGDPVEAESFPDDADRWSRRLRGDLDVLVMRALAKDPRERFDSVEQMAEEIGRHLEGLPIRSRPDSWLYRSGKFIRRHAAATVAAGVALALLLSLLGLLGVQRERARLEAAAARRAQTEAEDVADFLVDLFETSHAAGDGTGHLTARELLAAGAARLVREGYRPAAGRARLLDALGRAQIKLGHLDRAQPLVEEALALRREIHGTRHPAVADSLRSNALLAEARREIGQAERLYRQALDLRRELLGEGHPDTAESLADVGRILLGYPRREESLALLTRAVEILEGVVTTPGGLSVRRRLQLAYSADGLGFALQLGGQDAAAERRFFQALALRQEVLGLEHPLVAQSFSDLAWLDRRLGRPTQALLLGLRAAAIQQRTLGPDHPDLAVSLHNLGTILSEALDRDEKAEAFLRRALEINRVALGPRHLTVSTHLDTLANLLVDQGRFDEAADLFRQSMAIRIEVLGEDHYIVGLSDTNVAYSLRLQGRCEEAEPLLERARAVIETALGPEDFWAAAPVHELAACRRDLGRWVESEQLFRRALGILEAKGLGPTHPVWREVATDFAELLRRMEKPSEAQSLERRLAAPARSPA